MESVGLESHFDKKEVCKVLILSMTSSCHFHLLSSLEETSIAPNLSQNIIPLPIPRLLKNSTNPILMHPNLLQD